MMMTMAIALFVGRIFYKRLMADPAARCIDKVIN